MSITSKTAPAAPEKNAGDKPAKIAPATDFTPSGAPDQVTDIDAGHASVDNDPREGTTADMNRVDFNEPSGLTPPEEVVEKQLKND